ncbi:CHAT domain-containing protein [Herbidospora mongoliensis]|uniref:CHAT domain-containing protein n=1 Tax=Herbidospora mongoliensis TaxID=688067 RepID=UPI00082C1A7A|nr:CHAT domain-containing protein [Herbidospora mongoliensis]
MGTVLTMSVSEALILELREPDHPVFRVEVPFPNVPIGPSDHSEIRWYLEDFRIYPDNPAPIIAARTSARLVELGEELFTSIFHASGEARALWAAARRSLSELRVEIGTQVNDRIPLPLELLRDPADGTRLALAAESFAHVADGRAGAEPVDGVLRVLLVVSRPRLGRDVSYRSIGAHLVRLGERHPGLTVQVLRPPTFEALRERLEAARSRGEPFHLVHFDGHGVFGKPGETFPQGRIVFEKPGSPGNSELVDGTELGRRLAAYGVSVLVLNACGSAKTAHAWEIGRDDSGDPARTFGSLARNALLGGLTSVVAMRYDVYVDAAVTFTSAFYEALLAGGDPGAATTAGRTALAPARGPGLPQDDWLVPALYQRGPGARLPRAARDSAPAETGAEVLGRDGTTIALDRAFDRAPVVVLHGPIGAGKTTAALDFARWYTRTEGVPGPAVRTVLGAALPASAGHVGLWIWDDAEKAAEPARLKALLDAGTATKILIVGRDPARWAGTGVERVPLPPLDRPSCLALARSLAPDAEAATVEAAAAACEGNPLALRLALDPAADPPQAPPIDQRFTPDEREILAILTRMRGHVPVAHLTRIAARLSPPGPGYDDVAALLDRAADMGLLARHPGDLFTLHPLLPRWIAVEDAARARIDAAVVAEYDGYGHALFANVVMGSPELKSLIAIEEPQLLSARTLALAGPAPEAAIGPMQALRLLYEHQGRTGSWAGLLADLVPGLLSPDTFLPHDHLAFTDDANLVILAGYGAALASIRHGGERAAQVREAFRRGRSGEGQPRNTAVGLLDSTDLADLVRVADIAHSIGDVVLEARGLVSIGHWHLNQQDAGAREEFHAFGHFQEALGLAGDRDSDLAALALQGLASTRMQTMERLMAEHVRRLVDEGVLKPGRITVDLTKEAAAAVTDAGRYYELALGQLGDRADRGAILHQIGTIHEMRGDFDRALARFQEAIALHVAASDRFKAAVSRAAVAYLLARAGRDADARTYGGAALEQLSALPGGEEEVTRLRSLLASLESGAAASP